MSLQKALKNGLVIFSCLMLVSSFTRINVAPVKAYEFTIVATITQNPYWGRYGGYHDIWAAIKNDLAAIGINVEITQYNEFNWWKRVWDTGWDKPWAEGGWDLTILEWRLQPHALDPWFTTLVRSDLTPDEGGNNIFPWNNSDADELLGYGMSEFNALTRKTYLDAWQEVFMKDPPWINLYYPNVYEINGKYITGYDPSATWFYDTAHLNLNNTMLAEAREWVGRPAREPNTAIYAIVEPLWNLNPMFMDTRTDELQSILQWRTLYKWSCDPFPTDGSIPSWADYKIVPDMAVDYPEYLNGGLTVRVTLRDGMRWQWHNGTVGREITADDVVWTFETVMDPATDATGRGEFTHVINNVTKVNATIVDFNLNYTHSGFLSILANDWGTGCILPKYFFELSRPLRSDSSNNAFNDPAKWMPVSGPFMLDPDNPPMVDERITLIRNPSYYGYNTSIVGSPAWGPYNIDTFIMQWIKDPASRITAIANHDVDFGEIIFGPIYHPLPTNSYLRILQYDRPASIPIWLNFNNEYLSNRYIRMAIAHAIDYNYIINDILPDWSIETAIRGKTPILPQHYYTDENATTVQLFNTAISPYAQNVTRALEYMDRWKKSQVGYTSPYPGGIYLEGAAGDANFDGVVDVVDLGIWRDEGWPYGVMPVPFLPGQDKDPDFNNDGSIDQNPDYYIYRDEVPGKIYFPNPYS